MTDCYRLFDHLKDIIDRSQMLSLYFFISPLSNLFVSYHSLLSSSPAHMFLLSYPELIPRMKPPTDETTYVPRIYGFKINKDSAYYTLREPGSDEDEEEDEGGSEGDPEDDKVNHFPVNNRSIESHRKQIQAQRKSSVAATPDSGIRRPTGGSAHRSGGVGGENEGKEDDDVEEDEDEEDEEEEEGELEQLQPPSVEGLNLGGASLSGGGGSNEIRSIATSGRIGNGNSKTNAGNNKKNHTVKQGWE